MNKTTKNGVTPFYLWLKRYTETRSSINNLPEFFEPMVGIVPHKLLCN